MEALVEKLCHRFSGVTGLNHIQTYLDIITLDFMFVIFCFSFHLF